ncbi:MAG: hypothetical protein GIKADHBN_02590 [Phycisphaerales bacterium]|nr:hypothetical protein [Phycisphaerales bacterium]
MKFSNCLTLATVVGLAATAASAQNVVTPITGLTPKFGGFINMVDGSISQYGNRALTTTIAYDNDFVADGTPGVIDVTDGSPADYFFGGGVPHAGDFVTLDRRFGGRGIFGDRIVGYVDTFTFGISYNGVDTNVDSYHLFSDDLCDWDALIPDMTRGTTTGFYFADLPATGFPTATIYTVTDIVAAGLFIPVDDNMFVVEHWISLTGSGGTPVTDFNGITLYNGDGTATGNNGDNYMGASQDRFLYDSGGDGFMGGGDANWYYGGTPAVANLYMGIGVQACDADQDGSGFADTDDFDAFVAAFEAGC